MGGLPHAGGGVGRVRTSRLDALAPREERERGRGGLCRACEKMGGGGVGGVSGGGGGVSGVGGGGGGVGGGMGGGGGGGGVGGGGEGPTVR